MKLGCLSREGAFLVCLATIATGADPATVQEQPEGLVVHCNGRLVRVMICDDERRCTGLDPKTGKLRKELPSANYTVIDHLEPGLTPEQAPLVHEIELGPRKHYSLIVAGSGQSDASYSVELAWYSARHNVLTKVARTSIAADGQHVYDVSLVRAVKPRLVVSRRDAGVRADEPGRR